MTRFIASIQFDCGIFSALMGDRDRRSSSLQPSLFHESKGFAGL